jgi:hypothetical protein
MNVYAYGEVVMDAVEVDAAGSASRAGHGLASVLLVSAGLPQGCRRGRRGRGR